jgi:16S rRNA (cytosine967-C5)-methyltransferase
VISRLWDNGDMKPLPPRTRRAPKSTQQQVATPQQDKGGPSTRKPTVALETSGLAWQLQATAQVCTQVRAGQALPAALAHFFSLNPETSTAARGAVQDLAYRTMRWRGTAGAMLAKLADRAPDPVLSELLVVALAQWADPQHPYAEHVLVDQCVAAVRADHRVERAAGFANAILRRALRERDSLMASLATDEEAKWNYPAWWIKTVRREQPLRWQEILAAGNAQAPLTIRVNCRRATLAQVQASMQDAGIRADLLPGFPMALRLSPPRPVTTLPGFADGWWSVQDAAAQLGAPWLDVSGGMRVLDACAAPGGKTAHLLELADLDVLALDHDEQRLARVDENLARLGLVARGQAADATCPEDWWDGVPFDRILADVPCTASGIVRRHPDVRWLRRPEDIAQLATTAARILDALWKTLAPGGKMLVASCSVFKAEGPAQIAAFLKRHPDARIDPETAGVAQQTTDVRPEAGHLLAAMPLADLLAQNVPGPLFPTLNPSPPPHPRDEDAPDHDGFFYARLAKGRGAG